MGNHNAGGLHSGVVSPMLFVVTTDPKTSANSFKLGLRSWVSSFYTFSLGTLSKMLISKGSIERCAMSGSASTFGKVLSKCRTMLHAGCTSTITNAPRWPLVVCPQSSVWPALHEPSTFDSDGYWGDYHCDAGRRLLQNGLVLGRVRIVVAWSNCTFIMQICKY